MKQVLILITALIFTGCVRSELPKLPPNHLIDGTYIDIHSPNQEGWSKISHSNSEVTFGKYGNKYNESYIARVLFFPMEKTQNNQEFLELIKNEMSKSSKTNRYDILKSNFELSKQRKYPCVLGNILYKDKLAKTREWNKETLYMQVKSLYCKDPKRKNQEAGFMIGYSYRGDKVNSSFEIEAHSFINGVEFPEYK